MRTNETLDEVVKNNSAIRKDFISKGVDTVDFAKKLLGQIVFLYFYRKRVGSGLNAMQIGVPGLKIFTSTL